ncbi:hypothetical protein BU14_0328s0022 [Porphyra umbilicalis]|uniref:AAA+ ATPase domain-containing protein n=1 Tax=Porphyra umbilicalis TaxID=2786 RepID=A0A1X6NZ17_PORUM|nr:hypothetical protein BU14_0328s0022 [Porphyra umbilicalis]|eukprot:OSX73770.1 hypothetical protein BU14_0328s0022 [Porphyra umbilicalis]
MTTMPRNGLLLATDTGGTTAGAPSRLLPDADDLDRIAADEGVSTADLGVLEVNSRVGKLFAAILDYVARHPPVRPRAGTGGADASTTEAVAGPALWVNPSDAVDRVDVRSAADVEEAEATGTSNVGIKRPLYKKPSDPYGCYGPASLREGDQKRPPYKTVHGMGAAVVLWPPPPAATPDALRRAYAAEAGASPPATQPAAAEVNGDGSGSDGEAEASFPPDSARIHVLHMAAGHPLGSGLGAPDMQRFVLLVAAGGADPLKTFIAGVVDWSLALYAPPPAASAFRLFRFRTDDRASKSMWVAEGDKPGRPLSSVILPDGMAEALKADVEAFLSPPTKAWYRSHGVPYRRSYLLHGPPGSGKTSTIRALASTFRLTACFLAVTNGNFNNQILGDALASLPRASLLVIEDVDALFTVDRVATAAAGALTFSGLLNALDGLIAAESLLVAMTTNKPVTALDEALVRGGRVDSRWSFEAPCASQLARLFASYYPKADSEMGTAFGAQMVDGLGGGEGGGSMAAAQQLFIRCREASAADCLGTVPEFCAEYVADRDAAVAEAAAAAAERAAAATAAAAAAAEATAATAARRARREARLSQAE